MNLIDLFELAGLLRGDGQTAAVNPRTRLAVVRRTDLDVHGGVITTEAKLTTVDQIREKHPEFSCVGVSLTTCGSRIPQD